MSILGQKRTLQCVYEEGAGPSHHTAKLHCHRQAHETDIRVPSRCCESPGCIIYASYNVPGATRPVFCKQHATPDMVDVRHKHCVVEKCQKRASFGYTTPVVCADHRHEEMVYLNCKQPTQSRCKNKRCSAMTTHGACERVASFGPPHGKKETCKEHALAGYINLRNKRCQAPGCVSTASFRGEASTSAVYCKAHAEPGMFDTRHSRCQEKGCLKRPTYGYYKAVVCVSHKADDMINLNVK
eukprot:TRINITY_DN3286_c0_g1_i1.p1 TRINITY_DN3286_c0_g1~~TRINITY_DN3286_c0_g1_i1.p1  ORF type:complete len:241 (+),score=29.73 TRINITY_DN3286_c0_g1_i1:785-1507(+)